MTSIPLMDGTGKRESERPLSCSQCLPSFFLVKDSSLAHDCLFVFFCLFFFPCGVFRVLKHFRSSLHSRGQAVTARLRERTRKEETGERRQEVPPSPPSFSSLLLLVFLVRALITEKVSIAFTASVKRQPVMTTWLPLPSIYYVCRCLFTMSR